MDPISQCEICRHLGKGQPEGNAHTYCIAFPQGIPPDVLWNRVGHTRPLPELGQPEGDTTIFDPTYPKPNDPDWDENSPIVLEEPEGGS